MVGGGRFALVGGKTHFFKTAHSHWVTKEVLISIRHVTAYHRLCCAGGGGVWANNIKSRANVIFKSINVRML